LRLWDKHWSEQLAKEAVWLSGLVTFEQAAQIMSRVGQIPISSSSAWQRSAKWGAQLKASEAQQCAVANALPARSEVVPGEVSTEQVLGVAMDGAMVHVREEGWKELKTGCVFAVEVRPTLDKASGEMMDLAHATDNTYVAHLGGARDFGQQVWSEARRRDWTQAHDSIALGDGAPWIWNLTSEHFADSRQAVDWYHAKSHLSNAANVLHGEGSAEAQRWLKPHETLLFQGLAERIANELQAAAAKAQSGADGLRREAGYFRDNQRRMQYMELREDGYPIGSGMVETGCKQFRARFTGAGMRWSRPGVERLLPVRAAILSHRFDDAWKAAYFSPPN
jgi:hypothetical protein